MTRTPCPKVIMVYDMRHELLPEQFSPQRRLMRRISYGAGYRQAEAIICISQRTKRDLLRLHPRLARKNVPVVLWGAEHVDAWPRDPALAGESSYALSFGHFVNKGVDRVVGAWRILKQRGDVRRLLIVGLPGDARPAVMAKVAEAGLEGIISPLPWLDDDEFHARFAGAGLIVFPSDHEGFGLPAVEAQRLGIPLVISTDEALLEVTGGHATVVPDLTPEALADAVAEAWATPPEALAQARAHVESFTWRRMAAETRLVLADAATRAAGAAR
jgi:glycosyltransferase involved in cell wall biosynthesis